MMIDWPVDDETVSLNIHDCLKYYQLVVQITSRSHDKALDIYKMANTS